MRGLKLFSKNKENSGFTLVELIISITILVLIMLPLMNNFYRSAQLNKKAEEIQIQSNITSSIMEGLKDLNIGETLAQFEGPKADFTILPDIAGDPDPKVNFKVLDYNSTDGTYTEVTSDFNLYNSRTTYYFAINGIKDGSYIYDAVITMKADTYRNDTEMILNSYPMPDAINLDVMANGLLFSDGRSTENPTAATGDQDALDSFLDIGKDYANSLFEQSPGYLAAYDQWKNDCEIKEAQGTPAPAEPSELQFKPADYPKYCDEINVKSEITKTMKIFLNENAKNAVGYEIVYTCLWPSGNTSTIEKQISINNYANPLENVYLFYAQSGFKKDEIYIDNLTPSNNINFYLAKQGDDIISHNVSIYENAADQISFFTNLDTGFVKLMLDGSEASDHINKGIVKGETKNRIYAAEIKLYKYVDSDAVTDKYKDVVYKISSATENSNLTEH